MASYSTGPTPLPTTPAYDSPNAVKLLCQGAGQLVLTIANAAVSYQLGYGGGGSPAWESTEHFLLPGVWPITSQAGIDAVRVRSAAAALPANVALSAYG